MHRPWRGIGLVLVLACAPAVAAPAHDHADDRAPARWTGPALGADRSGDLRPGAAALLDAIAGADAPFTVGDARARGLVPTPPTGVAYAPPVTIRIWRRGLDGSTSSCSGRVDVIPFDRYVKGVLPHEWIRSWNPEALKAGAVAIRTYAAAWVAAGGKYDCADLDDTTASQVYKDEFFAVTDAAVDATAGVFVARGDTLVFAEYSAENGDPTEMGVAEPVCAGRARNGHGRGTCQWGTQRWALEGRTWDWMMLHYYPGAQLVGGGPAYAASLGEQAHQATLTAGEEMVVWLEYANAGRATWTRDTTFVGTTGPRDRASPFFKAENWVSASRPSAVDQAAVAPGAVGRFTWAMVAPEVREPTTFTEQFALVTADGEWFGGADDAVTWTITVVPRAVDDPGSPGEPGASGGDEAGGCDAGGGPGALLVVVIVAAFLRRPRLAAALGLALAIAAGACTTGERATRRAGPGLGGDSELVAIFTEAARQTGVPAELLAATAYTETRLAMIVPVDDGHAHGPAAWGLFALTDGAPRDLALAAALAGVTPDQARTDVRAHVHAAAALLADLAGRRPSALAGWEDALVAFGGGGEPGHQLADEVLARLAHGLAGRDDAGRRVIVSARADAWAGGTSSVVQGLGYPGAGWTPASTSNYQAAARGAADINNIVIHTVQGSYAGCISWFRNPEAQVSAHYVVRSSDGEVTQMVDDSDVAWHDACFNRNSIGIEHEGYVADPGRWYTAAMYMRSAQLTAWLADQYGIPKDRAHIQGHGETDDCSDHTDPGPGWDWTRYMDLVRTGGSPRFAAALVDSDAPRELVAGEEGVAWIELRNDSTVTWGIDETRVGTQDPMDRDSPFYVEGNWLAPNRATGADHSDYAPGATGRFTFAIRAPEVSEATTFHETFQLVQEGVAWFGPKVTFDITVRPRDGGAGPGPDPDPSEPGPDADPGDASGGCDAGRGGAGTGGALLVACAILLARATARRRRAP